MTSIPLHLALITVLDLAGLIFNFRLLLRCFQIQGKAKNTFLRKSRAFIICQCVCHFTILVADSVESWKLWFDTQPRDICNVFRLLSISTMFFQACNLTVILLYYSDHQTARENNDAFLKLKVVAALSLGFIGFAVTVLYYCSPPEFLSHIPAFNQVTFVLCVAFVVLLLAVVWRYVRDSEAIIKACPSLRSLIMLFIALLLMFCAVYISMLPGSIFGEDYEKARISREMIYSITTSYVFALCLPLILIDVIDSSHEEKNEKNIIIAV